jgi:hypothetical protein
MTHAIATGCSHTAGTGNNINDCYVSVLEKHYELPIHNWATAGGSCNDVLLHIVKAVRQPHAPKFIIAQWPNPIRRTAWINGKKYLQNINSCDESFMMLLKNGEENFYEPWIQSIIIANLLTRQASIPVINIMLENIDQQYHDRLTESNIELHVDEKLPGRTWLFDSAAEDKLHHSIQCHQQWAQRLIGLIDENTTR